MEFEEPRRTARLPVPRENTQFIFAEGHGRCQFVELVEVGGHGLVDPHRREEAVSDGMTIVGELGSDGLNKFLASPSASRTQTGGRGQVTVEGLHEGWVRQELRRSCVLDERSPAWESRRQADPSTQKERQASLLRLIAKAVASCRCSSLSSGQDNFFSLGL